MQAFIVRIYASILFRLSLVREWHRRMLLRRLLLRGHVAIGIGTYGLRWDSIDGASILAPVSIGNYCSIAPGVKILANVDHPLQQPSTYPFKSRWNIGEGSNAGGYNYDATTRGPIRIGSDVWIGQSAVVLSGLTIGDGCVIGAGAVVTHDLPPYSIAVGNPCRIVRSRFSAEDVARLIELKWWELDSEIIRKHLHLFYSEDIDNFIAAVSLLKASQVRRSSSSITDRSLE